MLPHNIQVAAGKRIVGGTAFPRRSLSVGGPCSAQPWSPAEIKGWRALGPKSVPAGGKADLTDDIEHVNNDLVI